MLLKYFDCRKMVLIYIIISEGILAKISKDEVRKALKRMKSGKALMIYLWRYGSV